MSHRWLSAVGGFALATAFAMPMRAQAKIDLNTATREQLTAFKGIGAKYADKIIAGRPYTMRSDLVKRNIMPAAEYLEIKANLTPTAEDAAAVKAAEKPVDLGPPKDNLGRINLNTATEAELAAVSGIGNAYARKIVEGRPFKSLEELVKRRVMPAEALPKIKNSVFVKG